MKKSKAPFISHLLCSFIVTIAQEKKLITGVQFQTSLDLCLCNSCERNSKVHKPRFDDGKYSIKAKAEKFSNLLLQVTTILV
jgi:hypothetical protein